MMIEIDRFCKRHDLTPSQFGRRAVNDPNFIARWKRGSEPKPRTLKRVRAFMEREDQALA